MTWGLGGSGECSILLDYHATNHLPIEYSCPLDTRLREASAREKEWPRLKHGEIPIPPWGGLRTEAEALYPKSYLDFVEDEAWSGISKKARLDTSGWTPRRKRMLGNHLAYNLCDMIHKVGRKCGATVVGVRKRKLPYLPHHIQNEIMKRDAAVKAMLNATPANKEAAREICERQRKATRKCMTQFRKRRDNKLVCKAAKSFYLTRSPSGES